jgi:hypothetical protein
MARPEAMPALRKYRQPRQPKSATRDDAPKAKSWFVAILLVLSLLLHFAVMLAFIFTSRHTPKWPEQAKEDKPPEVSLVLAPPPPQQKPDFIPTDADPNAPHQQSPLISDNDAALKSQNRIARASNVPLPDVTGHKDHSLDLHTRPSSRLSKAQPATPPTPQKPQQRKQEPQKVVAKPNQATKPAPPNPTATRQVENPEKATEADQKPVEEQQYDPNGLPVLPALNAPTIAPQTPPETQPVVQQVQRKPSPQSAPSFAVYQSDVAGSVGQAGNNSPAAMATDLGRYKAKVYRAVGARWYQKVNDQIGVLGVGTVHITYTIYSDGRLEIRADPDSGNPALMILHSISLNSMTEAAPFDPFSDKMKKEVGDSFTDDFSFSIYGN